MDCSCLIRFIKTAFFFCFVFVCFWLFFYERRVRVRVGKDYIKLLQVLLCSDNTYRVDCTVIRKSCVVFIVDIELVISGLYYQQMAVVHLV